MVLPRVRKRVWEKWKQVTGRHLTPRQIRFAEQFSSPFNATPKVSENAWKRDEVTWWTLNGHIFKQVKRTYFPDTPFAKKTKATYCYNMDGRLTSRSSDGFLGERQHAYNPPGKQLGKRNY